MENGPFIDDENEDVPDVPIEKGDFVLRNP